MVGHLGTRLASLVLAVLLPLAITACDLGDDDQQMRADPELEALTQAVEAAELRGAIAAGARRLIDASAEELPEIREALPW